MFRKVKWLIAIIRQYWNSNMATVTVQIQLEGNSLRINCRRVLYIVQLTRGLNCPTGMRCHYGEDRCGGRRPHSEVISDRFGDKCDVHCQPSARTIELTYITALWLEQTPRAWIWPADDKAIFTPSGTNHAVKNTATTRSNKIYHVYSSSIFTAWMNDWKNTYRLFI